MGFRENILSDSSQPIGKNLGCSNPQRFCEEPDTWAWAHSANGIQNSKSAYSTWVWKAKTTRRLQDFLCLAVQDRIPTKSLLCHRQIIQENICLFLLKNQEETTLHVLRDCDQAKDLLNLMGIPVTLKPTFQMPLVEWLRSNCLANCLANQPGLNWKILFPMMCNTTWFEPNQKNLSLNFFLIILCIHGISDDPMVLTQRIFYLAQGF